jgi:hypothetical protein
MTQKLPVKEVTMMMKMQYLLKLVLTRMEMHSLKVLKKKDVEKSN